MSGNKKFDLKIQKNILFSVIVCFLSLVAFAQTKSTNIKVINGVSYYIHVVEKKQSLYSISKLYNVTVEEIYASNPETKSGTKAGQEIKIPVKQSAAITNTVAVKNASVTNTAVPIDTSRFKTHLVIKSETMYGISKKYNITEADLKILNPSLINQGIKEGQLIIVGEKKGIVKPSEIRPQLNNPDSINPNVIHKPKKTAYNLTLILPFRLDQTLATDIENLAKNNLNFPAVPALALDFYLGFKRAADSLTSKDFEVNIDLFDVDDKDTSKLKEIVTSPKFKQTDMIFGPLYANGFKFIAQKAKENGIPIVSPITQTNKMLFDNVYASKTNPSQFTLMESLADYCIDSLVVNNANIILMTPPGNDAKELSYVKAFKKYYNEKQKQLGKLPKDTVTVVKGLPGVKSAFVPGVKNIIVTLSMNQVFIADFTTQLAIFADKKDVILCGWQNISNMDNIDQEYLNQLQFTFPCQNNIINTKSYDPVIESYRSQMNTLPGENYFKGFDVAYYYLRNLRDNGPDFVFNLHNLPAETNYMRFKFKRPDNITGFDNRGVFIFRYNNYHLQKSGWN